MPRAVLYEELQDLIDAGAQLVEVLPREAYRKLHLPRAVNIPLKELDGRTTEQLDKNRPVVAYCHDAL